MKIIGRLVDIEGAVLIYIYEICILKNLFKGHTKEELVQIRYPVLCLIDFFCLVHNGETKNMFLILWVYWRSHFNTLWECDKLQSMPFPTQVKKDFPL